VRSRLPSIPGYGRCTLALVASFQTQLTVLLPLRRGRNSLLPSSVFRQLPTRAAFFEEEAGRRDRKPRSVDPRASLSQPAIVRNISIRNRFLSCCFVRVLWVLYVSGAACDWVREACLFQVRIRGTDPFRLDSFLRQLSPSANKKTPGLSPTVLSALLRFVSFALNQY
jgi:hypothetical protein